jgi:hypothetical protein
VEFSTVVCNHMAFGVMDYLIELLNWHVLRCTLSLYAARREPRLNVFKGGSVLQSRSMSVAVGQIYQPGGQQVSAGCCSYNGSTD